MEPKDYIRKINALGIRELWTMKIRERRDAEMVLKKLRIMQKGVQQIKKEINLEIKNIRAVYRQKSSAAGEGSAFVLSLVGKKGLARSARSDGKRIVARERDRVIAPYEKLKLDIDNMLLKMDRLKIQLEEYIQKAKNET